MSREQQMPRRRFIAIPFSSGCRSHSSVDVVDTGRLAGDGKKPHPQGTCARPRANWAARGYVLFCSVLSTADNSLLKSSACYGRG